MEIIFCIVQMHDLTFLTIQLWPKRIKRYFPNDTSILLHANRGVHDWNIKSVSKVFSKEHFVF